MSEFLRSLGIGGSPQPRTQQQPPQPHQPGAPQQPYQPASHSSYMYQAPPSNGRASPAARGAPTSSASGYQPGPRGWAPNQGGGSQHAPSGSPPPAANPRSPSSTPLKSPSSSAAAGGSLDPHHQQWNQMSLEAMAAEHDQRTHTLSVLSSRLQHCMDGGDAEGASRAAHDVTEEKKLVRELGHLLHWRQKRAASEQRIRAQIMQRFSAEKTTVQEHRRQVEAIKRRLRSAFNGPHGHPPAAHSPTPPNPMSPPPAASSPAPAADGSSLFDLVARVKQDIGKHQVALEHQCLHVDAIEMQVCVEMAHAQEAKEAATAAPGGPTAEHDHSSYISPATSASSLQWSDELTLYFKTSRKDVVTTLQAVLAEIDGLTNHLKQTEAFMDYLKQQADH